MAEPVTAGGAVPARVIDCPPPFRSACHVSGLPLPSSSASPRSKAHLEHENPLLLDVVKSFRELDKVAYRLGVLSREESFTTQVPWWPMIAVLGTFSSGKSSFINHFLQARLQSTGNQAVDDKFTVICFGADDPPRTLPGLALDADPRFPFYQVSRDIESVATGEGHRIDAYLQLRTCRSEPLRGKIIIDSPGFDADAQRTATLRIADHIIDLSDLVLVFFDARHPEPGAMQDTLRHLVGNTIHRPDSNKFLHILNQIDNAAREDNPEDVFAAWQRALAQAGLTAGRSTASTTPTPRCRSRIRSSGTASKPSARRTLPRSTGAFTRSRSSASTASSACSRRPRRHSSTRWFPRWRRPGHRGNAGCSGSNGVVFGALVLAFGAWSVSAGYWSGFSFSAPWFDVLVSTPWLLAPVVVLVAAGGGYLHYLMRRVSARFVARRIARDPELEDVRTWVTRAIAHNTRGWRTILTASPAGWGRGARRRIAEVASDADRFVQRLNDRFTDPSGSAGDDTASGGGRLGPPSPRPDCARACRLRAGGGGRPRLSVAIPACILPSRSDTQGKTGGELRARTLQHGRAADPAVGGA